MLNTSDASYKTAHSQPKFSFWTVWFVLHTIFMFATFHHDTLSMQQFLGKRYLSNICQEIASGSFHLDKLNEKKTLYQCIVL